MKSNNLRIKQMSLMLAGIATMIIMSLTMNSCTKQGITTEAFNASNLRVVNGLPDRSGVKFYLDTSNLTLAGHIDFNQVSAPTYYVVNSGLRKAKFYSTNTQDTFARKDIQLEPNKNYTLFMAGDAAKPIFWLTEDKIVPADADKVKLRLANLAITGVNIDVTIQSDDISAPQPEVKVFSNVAPQSISDYILASVAVSKGNSLPRPHTIRIYEAGTTNLLVSRANVNLQGTDIETIIVTGIDGGSPDLAIRTSQEWLDW